MREGVAMKKEELRKLILTAKGAVEADVVIKNCKVVNVFTGEIQEGDIAISGDQIAGVGQYQGKVEVDAGGRYAAPGFIDSHIHIESAPKNWADCWCLMAVVPSSQILMKS